MNHLKRGEIMKLSNIKKTYHNKNNTVEALKGITVDLENKGIIVLLGPSGCGKSTLLNILSGQDKDFEGKLEITTNLDYITQDFRLFEAMSIEENLLLVSDDQDKIQKYLKQFSLEEHAHKKVKNCSNGQKKRVQFIRALLQSPGLLLCDEPTAALDHENARLLMDQLKEISQDIQIFLVTHDIALAEKYANRILTMDAGKIIKDEIIYDTNLSEEGRMMEKKTLSKTFKVVLLQLKSRPVESAFLACMALILSVGLFISTQIFSHVESQTQMQYIWEKRINQIVTKIDDRNKVEGGETSYIYEYVYEDFDVYKDSDIQKVLEEIDEILAVETFYDVYIYDNVARTLSIKDWQKESFQTGEDCLASGKYSSYTKQPGYYPILASEEIIYDDFIKTLQKRFEPNPQEETGTFKGGFINSQGELVSNKEYHSLEEIQEDMSYLVAEYEYRYLITNRNYEKFAFHPYEIASGKQLPLIMGEMPDELNEAVVDVQSAELIRYQYGFDSLESMIGKQIEISIPLATARFMYGDDSKVHHAQFTISGIMPYSNPDQNQIFFLEGGIKETLLKGIVNEGADVSYTIVNFMLDADSDFEAVCERLNEIMPVDQNSFVMAVNESSDGGEIKEYQNPRIFIMYSILAIVSILLVIGIYYFLNRNRFRKEKMILSVYGYSTWMDTFLRMAVLYLISGIIWLFSSSIIISQLNEIAKSLRYDSFLKVDYFFMILMILIAYFIQLLIDQIVGGSHHD